MSSLDGYSLGVAVFRSRTLMKPGEHALIELRVAPLGVFPTKSIAHHPLGEIGKLERVLEVPCAGLHTRTLADRTSQSPLIGAKHRVGLSKRCEQVRHIGHIARGKTHPSERPVVHTQ